MLTMFMQIRRKFLKKRAQFVSVPVWVVGNLTLGGVGKTPLVAAIAQHFVKKGMKVGIVSRGYRARCRTFPYEVQETDTADYVGDEPLLLKKKTACPVVIAPKRVEAVNLLVARYQLDLILSDDGLQHERMGRAFEIVVIDGEKGLAGFLREGVQRLQSVNMVVINGETRFDFSAYHPYTMQYVLHACIALQTKERHPLALLKGKQVSVVTGIGNPGRFIRLLQGLGMEVTPYIFPDHYRFKREDFEKIALPIVMTEKDAVKCEPFAAAGWYSVEAAVCLADAFWHQLEQGFLCKDAQ